MRSYDFFWQKYEILNKKKFWKKTTKSTFFSKKKYTLNNLGFCIKSALKKIIVTVCEKNKKKVLFVFFFQKFFLFKISYFCQKKVVWPQKLYPRYFRRYSKDLSKEFEKKSIFVDFWWFWQKIWFSPKFRGFRG